MQANYIDTLTSPGIKWERHEDGDSSDYWASFEGLNVELSRSEAPSGVQTTLTVQKGREPVARLQGGFAELFWEEVDRRQSGESGQQLHFPTVHDGSPAIPKFFKCLIHCSGFRKAKILEQLFEAAHHAPGNSADSASWQFSKEGDPESAQEKNTARIDFNGMRITLQWLSRESLSNIEVPMYDESGATMLRAIKINSAVRVTNEDGEILYSDIGQRPENLIRILERRFAPDKGRPPIS